MPPLLKTDIIQWDVKALDKALELREQKIDWNQIKNGLELGSNQGGLSLLMALKGKKMICSDLMNVEENAKGLHTRYQVTKSVDYQDIDSSNTGFLIK